MYKKESLNSTVLISCLMLFLISVLPLHGLNAELQPSAPKNVRLASLVIDDLGFNLHRGRRAIELSGAISYSILPATPYAKQLAGLAYEKNKEVLLHLPMEGSTVYGSEANFLTQNMSEQEFRGILQKHIAAVPHAVGVNNHMGSALTPLLPQMTWLMEELSKHALFFVDSRTTHRTVALNVAKQYSIPVSKRDVFLDNEREPEKIRQAFKRFVSLAKKRHGVLAIAHPYPETLDVLEEELAKLSEENVRLVPVADLIHYQSKVQAHVSDVVSR